MGYTDLLTANFFESQRNQSQVVVSPQEARLLAMQGTPADRSRFVEDIYIETEQFKFSFEFISKLVERAKRTNKPGGLWLIGEGGTGKSFLLKKLEDKFAPIETGSVRVVPVLIISLNEMTSLSSILMSMLFQLGQDPELLYYKNNDDLKDQVVDAMRTAETQAVLFDESHNIWLKPNGKTRAADRSGGTIGGFLLRFYDLTGVAMIFAGTPGLDRVLELNDKQSGTRWEGRIRLSEFAFDEKFIGLLATLDQALPFPEGAHLSEEGRARKIFLATKGNFRSLKHLLAEAVFMAAESHASCVTDQHLLAACETTHGLELNPFA